MDLMNIGVSVGCSVIGAILFALATPLWRVVARWWRAESTTDKVVDEGTDLRAFIAAAVMRLANLIMSVAIAVLFQSQLHWEASHIDLFGSAKVTELLWLSTAANAFMLYQCFRIFIWWRKATRDIRRQVHLDVFQISNATIERDHIP